MKIIEITSQTNEKLKFIRGLVESNKRKDSLEQEVYLIEGKKLLQEALTKNVSLIDVIVGQTYYDSSFAQLDFAKQLDPILDSITVVPDRLFAALYTTDTSCGIIATAKQTYYNLDNLLSSKKTLLVGDNIQDPGNLGTIIRTALAFDAGGLILSKGSVDCYNPKVIRSSMGAIFTLPIIVKAELSTVIKEIKAHNYKLIALDSKAKQPFWEQAYNNPIAYILGNEGHGISSDIQGFVDNTLCIPINSACESLNVAVTAGIILMQDKFKIINRSQ